MCNEHVENIPEKKQIYKLENNDILIFANFPPL